MTERMTKALLLDTAKEAVAGRGLNYGRPEDNFERIARRWAVHFKNRYGLDVPVDAIDVAEMMADMKLARLEHQPNHLDSWVDLAGYAACGAEIACAPSVDIDRAPNPNWRNNLTESCVSASEDKP